MNICSKHGEEIAYASLDCPACDQIEDIRYEHDSEITDLELELDQALGELQDLKDKFGVQNG